MRNLPSTRIKSTGGFLRQRNHTLLIGLSDRQVESAVTALTTATEERVEFVSSLPGMEQAPPAEAQAVKVQGATVFMFPVERYEAI